MSDHHDEADPRVAELLGAASAGDLSAAEQRELDELCAQDPHLAAERDALDSTSAALRRHTASWRAAQPPPSLREAVLARVAEDQPQPTRAPQPSTQAPAASAPGTRGRPRADAASAEGPSPATEQASTVNRSRLRRSLALAACAALGVAATLGVQAILGDESQGADPNGGAVAEEPLGPPGELGAQEPVSFSDPGAGVAVDGALIAHTWGTETVLEIDGLPVGDPFTLVLVGADGQEIESGSFLGSEVPVDCRMNGAVLREDVQRLEIRDASGVAVTAAELPDVG